VSATGSNNSTSAEAPAQSNVPGIELLAWLKRQGAQQDKVGT
jgi:hypothetical protein